jgi:hypothetical protein
LSTETGAVQNTYLGVCGTGCRPLSLDRIYGLVGKSYTKNVWQTTSVVALLDMAQYFALQEVSTPIETLMKHVDAFLTVSA